MDVCDEHYHSAEENFDVDGDELDTIIAEAMETESINEEPVENP